MAVNMTAQSIAVGDNWTKAGNDYVGSSPNGVTFPYDSTREVVAGAYHVDPVSGSDANNGILVADGGTGAWATINTNLATLTAGDTLYLREGTHPVTLQDMKFGYNDGTVGNLIEITSYPSEQPVIDCQGTIWIDRFDQKDYWKFSHFKIINYITAIEIGQDIASTNCEFYSILAETNVGGDNVGFIRWLQGTDINIDRVKTVYTGLSQPHLNTGGIYINNPSGANTGVIDHYESYGFPQGIYFKHGKPDELAYSSKIVVKNSFITETTRNCIGYNPASVLFENSIFTETVDLSADDGGSAADWNVFDHCTLYGGVYLRNNADAGDVTYAGAQNNKFADCIILARFRIGEDASVTSDSDYNLIAPSIIEHTFIASPQSSTAVDLAGWRTFNSSDANSIEATPVFNEATPINIADFALASGSGLNAASDGADMGADVNKVGVMGL